MYYMLCCDISTLCCTAADLESIIADFSIPYWIRYPSSAPSYFPERYQSSAYKSSAWGCHPRQGILAAWLWNTQQSGVSVGSIRGLYILVHALRAIQQPRDTACFVAS